MKPLRIYCVLALFLASLLLPQTGGAVSLWSDGVSLFGDKKAHAVGDIITIIISESSTAKRSGDSANAKSSNVNLPKGTGKLDFIPQLGASYSDGFQAKGSISNTNLVTARITVQVTEVKPNGNLTVSGQQTIKQGKDEQRIHITGTVRPEDVTADNTVLSTFVADAQIRIEGSGPLAAKQRQGILSQIFNFLF